MNVKDLTKVREHWWISTRQQEGMEDGKNTRKLPKSNPERSRHTQSHGHLDILQEKALSH